MPDIHDGPPSFPYSAIWEERGDDPVTLGNLEGRRTEFRTLAHINVQMKLGEPAVGSDRLENLIAILNLSEEAAEQLKDKLELVVGWYLSPGIRRKLNQSALDVRNQMQRVAQEARTLRSSLDGVDPQTAAVMYWIFGAETEALQPDRPLLISDLASRVGDLALVAERMAQDMPVRSGRPKEYMRDTALGLAMAAVETSIDERVRVSRRTIAQPQPHFSNAPGRLVRDLFAEMGQTDERILAQAVERIGRKRRKNL